MTSSTTSLISDSKAMATTRPRCFCRGEICRVPNNTPNRISEAQNTSAMVFGGTSLLSTRSDSVTARTCSAM